MDKRLCVDILQKETIHNDEYLPRPYEYLPLREPGKIRLLQLESSSAERISCSLVTARLENAPEYDALSYVWGVNPSHSIYIDDAVVEVTINLFHALLQLRQRGSDKKRLLWIDQICIDQKNVSERSEQVAVMGHIFARAELVIMWLGVEQTLTKVAFDAIRKLNANIIDIGGHTLFLQQTPFEKFQVLEDFIITAGTIIWRALYQLIQNEWFNRIWVFQEYILARKGIFLCGNEELPSNILMFAFFAIWQANQRIRVLEGSYTSQDVATAQQNYNSLVEMYTIYNERRSGVSISLLDLIAFTGGRFAIDPRDRLYAVLGLASDSDGEFLVVDYNSSVEEVYRKLALYFLKVQQSLEIFSLVKPSKSQTEPEPKIPSPIRLIDDISIEATEYVKEAAHISSATEGYIKLPSWVPDLRKGRRNMPIRYRAAGSSKLNVTVLGNEVISCRGMIIDKIRDTSSDPRHEGVISDSKMYSIMQECDGIAALQKQPYPSEEDSTDILWRTLIMNCDWNYNPASLELRTHYLKWRDYLQLMMDGEDNERDAEISTWGALVSRQGIFFDYVLVVTMSGYLGLAPAGVRAGDEICILLGGHAPFAIRLQDSGDNFTLLGQVYIHGLMDGEAMHMADIPLIDIVFS